MRGYGVTGLPSCAVSASIVRYCLCGWSGPISDDAISEKFTGKKWRMAVKPNEFSLLNYVPGWFCSAYYAITDFGYFKREVHVTVKQRNRN